VPQSHSAKARLFNDVFWSASIMVFLAVRIK